MLSNIEIQKSPIIFLIGFMCCGKTTLGKQLVATLHRDFADTDNLIEEQCGKTIAEIFATEGEEKFRQYEREVLHNLLHCENLVVACGGGLPCFFDNMERMNACGTTIYLKAEVALLAQRAAQENNHRRPLLEGKTGLELHRHIEALLAEREKYYLQAMKIAQV
jgi:shikimate kinase